MEMPDWLNEEILGSHFKDKRLGIRFKQIVKAIHLNQGKPIPEACGSWSETKATYRFLSNERVDDSDILSGHIARTHKRIKESKGPILVLHDTTEFTYHRENTDRIGLIQKAPNQNKYVPERKKEYKVCGILMHASLAVTSEGLPLGLTAARYWSRKVFKNTNQMKRHINPARIPIEEKESIKWLLNLEVSTAPTGEESSKLIHIGDRENDIYEYFCRCKDLGSYFLTRACVNRLANESTIIEEVGCEQVYTQLPVEFIQSTGEKVSTTGDIRFKSLRLHPPIGKHNRYTDLNVTFVSAVESNKPESREPIKWSFITNLPVSTETDVKQLLDWYKQRWKIETYFKILKSGLKVEGSKLRTAERLSRLISICCILAWRIHWMTFLNRETEQLPPNIAFDKVEIKIISFQYQKYSFKSLQDFIIGLAMLGGYLNRQNDPPPGNTLIWRGMNKLYELKHGFLMAQSCG